MMVPAKWSIAAFPRNLWEIGEHAIVWDFATAWRPQSTSIHWRSKSRGRQASFTRRNFLFFGLVSQEEIEAVVFQSGPTKAPGLDRLSMVFYQRLYQFTW